MIAEECLRMTGIQPTIPNEGTSGRKPNQGLRFRRHHHTIWTRWQARPGPAFPENFPANAVNPLLG